MGAGKRRAPPHSPRASTHICVDACTQRAHARGSTRPSGAGAHVYIWVGVCVCTPAAVHALTPGPCPDDALLYCSVTVHDAHCWYCWHYHAHDHDADMDEPSG